MDVAVASGTPWVEKVARTPFTAAIKQAWRGSRFFGELASAQNRNEEENQ
jgi:hypothetical protein